MTQLTFRSHFGSSYRVSTIWSHFRGAAIAADMASSTPVAGPLEAAVTAAGKARGAAAALAAAATAAAEMANEVSALAWAAHQAAEEALAVSQLPPVPAGFELDYRGLAAMRSCNTGLAAAAPKDAARVAKRGPRSCLVQCGLAELAERVWPTIPSAPPPAAVQPASVPTQVLPAGAGPNPGEHEVKHEGQKESVCRFDWMRGGLAKARHGARDAAQSWELVAEAELDCTQ